MHPDTPAFSSPVDMNPKFPDHEHLKCPRCNSGNTKFCYYNNYNLSQPRHFCKNCRRYWTKGGTLRNIPIGGGSRKITKRNSNSGKHASPVTAPPPPPPPTTTTMMMTMTPTIPPVTEPSVVYRFGGNPMGAFGNLLMEGSNLSNLNLVRKSNEDVLIRNPIVDDLGSNFLRLNDESNGNGGSERGESSCWNGGENGWPDLSIFTPGSSFH